MRRVALGAGIALALCSGVARGDDAPPPFAGRANVERVPLAAKDAAHRDVVAWTLSSPDHRHLAGALALRDPVAALAGGRREPLLGADGHLRVDVLRHADLGAIELTLFDATADPAAAKPLAAALRAKSVEPRPLPLAAAWSWFARLYVGSPGGETVPPRETLAVAELPVPRVATRRVRFDLGAAALAALREPVAGLCVEIAVPYNASTTDEDRKVLKEPLARPVPFDRSTIVVTPRDRTTGRDLFRGCWAHYWGSAGSADVHPAWIVKTWIEPALTESLEGLEAPALPVAGPLAFPVGDDVALLVKGPGLGRLLEMPAPEREEMVRTAVKALATDRRAVPATEEVLFALLDYRFDGVERPKEGGGRAPADPEATVQRILGVLESVRVTTQTNRHVQVVRPERFAEALAAMNPELFDEVVALVRLCTCWTPAEGPHSSSK
jgi:hypothetical protein